MQTPYAKKRKRYLINKKVQGKYAVLSIAMLVLYTMLLLIAIFGPPIYLFTSPDVPLAVRTEAANAVLLINSYLWPGIGVIILLFGMLSIFFTHRLAGSLFAIKRAIERVSEGDLTARVRLRKHYDLQDLAQELNSMIEKQETALSTLDERFRSISSRVREMSTGPGPGGDAALQAAFEDIEKLLQRYRPGNTRQKA